MQKTRRKDDKSIGVAQAKAEAEAGRAGSTARCSLRSGKTYIHHINIKRQTVFFT